MPLKTLDELTVSTCHWPLAEFERNVLLYCGEAVELRPDGRASPYCPCHARRAYVRRAALRLPPSITHQRTALARPAPATVALIAAE